MTDKELLKKEALRAAEALEFVFEDTKIRGIKFEGDHVKFYEGDKVAFDFSKEQVLHHTY